MRRKNPESLLAYSRKYGIHLDLPAQPTGAYSAGKFWKTFVFFRSRGKLLTHGKRMRRRSASCPQGIRRSARPTCAHAWATTLRCNVAISHAVTACAVVSSLVGDADAAVLSSKRGFADVGANYSNLQATGAGWYYTWGTGVGNPGNFDAKHYPMFWSAPGQGTI